MLLDFSITNLSAAWSLKVGGITPRDSQLTYFPVVSGLSYYESLSIRTQHHATLRGAWRRSHACGCRQCRSASTRRFCVELQYSHDGGLEGFISQQLTVVIIHYCRTRCAIPCVLPLTRAALRVFPHVGA